MDEKMERLDLMVNCIAEFCDENRIEFVFACCKGNQNIIAYHLDKNPVLTKALSIVHKLIKK